MKGRSLYPRYPNVVAGFLFAELGTLRSLYQGPCSKYFLTHSNNVCVGFRLLQQHRSSPNRIVKTAPYGLEPDPCCASVQGRQWAGSEQYRSGWEACIRCIYADGFFADIPVVRPKLMNVRFHPSGANVGMFLRY